MIRLFTMFLVRFNAYLAKLVIYFCFTEYKIAVHLRFTGTKETRKVVAHSSGLQKLENSNLKILKFEAHYRLRGQILDGFFRFEIR